MRGTRASADLVRAYAELHKISVRTARDHRKNPRTGQPSPQWVAFVTSSAVASPPGAGATSEREGAGAAVDRAIRVRDDAWALLERLRECMEVAAPESLPVLARAHADARKNWEAACAYAEEVQVTAGQLIPLDRLRDVQRTAVSRLGQIVRAWPNNIALRLPPELHAHYYAAERAERPALRRAILDLDAALEGLVASC